MTTTPLQTILWHDYETWGANPQKDHPSQFAAIRTDFDLNEIDKPLNWFCQIPNDYLPHPMACLITGITPQQSLRDGLLEYDFMHRVMAQMAKPGTCSAGYNSLRFDDEVTRYTAYRNFHDPYAREWQNGNSRWDIIDLVRAAYALRPEGIEWVYKEDGTPSFKLEELSVANGITHLDAHDALSDVRATIGLAKRIKAAQPKLYDYVFSLRFKQNVNNQIDCFNMKPLVHISSKIPAQYGCCTWIVPICPHPTNKNATVCVNLAQDPTPLFEYSAQELREKLYKRSDELAENEARVPIKLLHSNKCPVIAPAKTLTPDIAERLNINRDECLKNLQLIKDHHGLSEKMNDIFDEAYEAKQVEADHALYTGGFFNNSDKAKIEQVRQLSESQLTNLMGQFDDPRLNTLLFYYRGRNFPGSFDEYELKKWQAHRQFRLTSADSPASMNLEMFLHELEQLAQTYQQDQRRISIIKDLYHYAEQL